MNLLSFWISKSNLQNQLLFDEFLFRSLYFVIVLIKRDSNTNTIFRRYLHFRFYSFFVSYLFFTLTFHCKNKFNWILPLGVFDWFDSMIFLYIRSLCGMSILLCHVFFWSAIDSTVSLFIELKGRGWPVAPA